MGFNIARHLRWHQLRDVLPRGHAQLTAVKEDAALTEAALLASAVFAMAKQNAGIQSGPATGTNASVPQSRWRTRGWRR